MGVTEIIKKKQPQGTVYISANFHGNPAGRL